MDNTNNRWKKFVGVPGVSPVLVKGYKDFTSYENNVVGSSSYVKIFGKDYYQIEFNLQPHSFEPNMIMVSKDDNAMLLVRWLIRKDETYEPMGCYCHLHWVEGHVSNTVYDYWFVEQTNRFYVRIDTGRFNQNNTEEIKYYKVGFKR